MLGNDLENIFDVSRRFLFSRYCHFTMQYNEVNGVPSCANDWLLGTLLRGAWEFDGYVTSDCDADADVYNTHHYTATPTEAGG